MEYVQVNSDDEEVKSFDDEQKEDEMEKDNEEEDVPPSVKIGPPRKKRRKSPPSADIEKTPTQVAGSSKMPLPQNKSKSKKSAKTRPVVGPVSIWWKMTLYCADIWTGGWGWKEKQKEEGQFKGSSEDYRSGRRVGKATGRKSCQKLR